MVDKEIIATFNESLERCQADSHFLSLFYRKFVISNAEIRDKFSNTNMEHQKVMLHASLKMIMLAIQGDDGASTYLDRVAKRHSKSELDIRPELYDIWLETLIETVSETDPEFNNDIENAWRKVMLYGIEYLISKYNGKSELAD